MYAVADRILKLLRNFSLLKTDLDWYMNKEPKVYEEIRRTVAYATDTAPPVQDGRATRDIKAGELIEISEEEARKCVIPHCCECSHPIHRALWPDHLCEVCSKPLCHNTYCQDKHKEEHGHR